MDAIHASHDEYITGEIQDGEVRLTVTSSGRFIGHPMHVPARVTAQLFLNDSQLNELSRMVNSLRDQLLRDEAAKEKRDKKLKEK